MQTLYNIYKLSGTATTHLGSMVCGVCVCYSFLFLQVLKKKHKIKWTSGENSAIKMQQAEACDAACSLHTMWLYTISTSRKRTL